MGSARRVRSLACLPSCDISVQRCSRPRLRSFLRASGRRVRPARPGRDECRSRRTGRRRSSRIDAGAPRATCRLGRDQRVDTGSGGHRFASSTITPAALRRSAAQPGSVSSTSAAVTDRARLLRRGLQGERRLVRRSPALATQPATPPAGSPGRRGRAPGSPGSRTGSARSRRSTCSGLGVTARARHLRAHVIRGEPCTASTRRRRGSRPTRRAEPLHRHARLAVRAGSERRRRSSSASPGLLLLLVLPDADVSLPGEPARVAGTATATGQRRRAGSDARRRRRGGRPRRAGPERPHEGRVAEATAEALRRSDRGDKFCATQH